MTEIIVSAMLIGWIFAPLGCIAIWKKYTNYGEGFAHSSILASVISGISGLPILYTGIIIAVFFVFSTYKVRFGSGNNAATGLISGFMTASALVLISIYPSSISINNLLLGDIISSNKDDVLSLTILLIFGIALLWYFYRPMLLVILSREIAYSRGVNTTLIELVFLMFISYAILITIKIVGALLVTSMMIIPAITARLVSSTPLSMLINATLIATIMNLSGITISLYYDIPFSPVIILSGGIIYFVIYVIRKEKL